MFDVLADENDDACSGLVATTLIGRSHIIASTSMSGGPCQVAMSACGLVIRTGLSPAGRGLDAITKSKWSLHFSETVKRSETSLLFIACKCDHG